MNDIFNTLGWDYCFEIFEVVLENNISSLKVNLSQEERARIAQASYGKLFDTAFEVVLESTDNFFEHEVFEDSNYKKKVRRNIKSECDNAISILWGIYTKRARS